MFFFQQLENFFVTPNFCTVTYLHILFDIFSYGTIHSQIFVLWSSVISCYIMISWMFSRFINESVFNDSIYEME